MTDKLKLIQFLGNVKEGEVFTLRDFTYKAKKDARLSLTLGHDCLVANVFIEATRDGYCADVFEFTAL